MNKRDNWSYSLYRIEKKTPVLIKLTLKKPMPRNGTFTNGSTCHDSRRPMARS